MTDKTKLRAKLRQDRRAHAAEIPDMVRALLFKQPPTPLMALIPAGSTIGLYHASDHEAPAIGYAKFFAEEGYTSALPRFESAENPMEFALFTDPFGESDLAAGPFGIKQPLPSAANVIPDVVFVPLLGFSPAGDRLGQGGGHYDRWLAQHPGTLAIGMGWDCQIVENLPTEPHDVALQAVVTPTRLYGPF